MTKATIGTTGGAAPPAGASRRRVAVLAWVALTCALAGCAVDGTVDRAARPRPSVPPEGPAQGPSAPVTRAPIAALPVTTDVTGVWQGHGAAMRVAPDGRFELSARTYRVCGTEAPPCDSFVGDEIIDGVKVTGTVQATSDRWAEGQVVTTTDPGRHPVGPFTLELDPASDTVRWDETLLCGPRAVPTTCGA